jgi:ribosomal protein L24
MLANVGQMKKHMKARGDGQKGSIISKEAPMHYSNVMLVDPVNG